jgi:ribosomal protein L25 (general stress protein Ctc)
MSNQETLKIFERDTTITNSKLRSAGYIPATVYGRSFETLAIQVKAHEFELALNRGIKLFKLEGFGKSVDVEVKQLQRENTKRAVLHIEFFVPSPPAEKVKNKKQQTKSQSAAPKAPEKTEAPAIVEAEQQPRVEEVVSAH